MSYHLTNKSPKGFEGCCTENTNAWKTLKVYMLENNLTRNQVYLLAAKRKIEMVTYKQRYNVRNKLQ